ncbi:MAG TPA: aminoacyl-tRNA hydrolase [Phycisphaeraceae bacterium]|nr:aminoacyl-tRNA hydrolase [Phycisphaeraceae bacterium]
MKLIVGLGNPGREYTGTRHNAGFMAVDRLATRHVTPGSIPRSRFHSGLHEVLINNVKCLLIQPTTYMNRSGMAVGEAVRFYRVDIARDLMIIVDDVALPCGSIRLRPGGSAGGHNGLADIERHLGTQSYPRCRIGIGSPQGQPQRDYVLTRFSPEQRVLVEQAVERACDAVECWVADGIDKAMNEYNKTLKTTRNNDQSEGSDDE